MTSDEWPRTLARHPVHLGLGATAVSEPQFSGNLEWYEAYVTRHASDGAEGRLVSVHSFIEPWSMWEMHPHGAELVLCLEGTLTLHQELAGGTRVTQTLQAGEYAVNPAGVWHTADTDRPARVLFITAGLGTQHRAR